MPSQSTIYDFGEVRHQAVTLRYPETASERIEIRLRQDTGSIRDTVDLTLVRYYATKLAWELFEALGIDPTKGKDE